MNEVKVASNVQIGARIRNARLKRKMSQAAVAAEAKVALSHYTKIENGQATMRVDTLIRILEVLQVSSDWILLAKVPHSDTVVNNQFDSLYSDCTNEEKASLFAIAEVAKEQFRLLREDK